jgi:glycosyltransferase 2 family protein
MKRRSWLVWLVVLAIALFALWKLHESHFDWNGFLASFRTANWRRIAIAVAIIYSNYLIRALRWSIFLRPSAVDGERVKWWRLIGSQFIGFAGLAIFGRIGELIRPYLVARRTGLTFSSQIAVVTVERVFDLGAFAILFALNLLLSPSLQTLPYHDRFHTVGFVVAGMTVAIAVFVVAVRLSGGVVATMMQRLIGLVSKGAGEAAGEKILAFRAGLNVIEKATDFVWVAGLSLLLWGSIAVAYVEVMHAFPPPVQDLTLSHTVVLMGFSVVGSVVQLPGVGGGSQVGTISALTLLFGIPSDLAASAGLMLWLVTFMSVIPAGLIFARVERVSMKDLASRSEAEEDVATHEAATVGEQDAH